MSTSSSQHWSPADIDAFRADELTIATRRPDGSLRNGVIIWMVVVAGDLYIRAVKGVDGPWFRGATSTREAEVTVGGQTWSTTLEEVGDAQAAEIDAAYLAKYSKYPRQYVDSVLTPGSIAATLRVVPSA